MFGSMAMVPASVFRYGVFDIEFELLKAWQYSPWCFPYDVLAVRFMVLGSMVMFPGSVLPYCVFVIMAEFLKPS